MYVWQSFSPYLFSTYFILDLFLIFLLLAEALILRILVNITQFSRLFLFGKFWSIIFHWMEIISIMKKL